MNSFRQVCDKPCANSITQTEWSPHHDLVAVVTSNGDVRLHRMQWQKVWVMSSKESPATCCAWKNNGKLLAIGYANGEVRIVEIEKATSIHTLKHSGKITSLKWSSGQHDGNNKKSSDMFKEFLPEVKKEELVQYLAQSDTMISDGDQQCFLTVGTEQGDVHLYLDGMFPVLKLPKEKYPIAFKQHCISTVNLCVETGTLTVISKSSTSEEDGCEGYYLHQFESHQLCSSSNELFTLSSVYTNMYFLVQRCEKVLKQIADSSEDISLKINSKLDKLEKLVEATESSVAAEFTIAYATGETSPELETFLTQHLTSKGLKQIEQNVQLAYASMHSDITEEMELMIQHLMVHLLQLYGMAKWTDKYEYLGITENAVLDCFQKLGKFSMRILKLLQVICSDIEEFIIFFTWLTCLCFQVSAEAPATFPQLSFDDYDVMVDFLENRLKKSSSGSYNLERVSQFFIEDEKLGTCDEQGTNVWFEYVSKIDCLKDSPFIVVSDNSSTLQVLFEQFVQSFNALFDSTNTKLSTALKPTKSTKLFNVADNHEENCAPVLSFLTKETSLLVTLLACSCDSDRMFVMKLSPNTENIYLAGVSIEPPNVDMEESMNTTTGDQQLPQYTIKYSTFYSNEYLTFLYDSGLPDSDQVTSSLAQLSFEDTVDALEFISLKPSADEGLLDQELDIGWYNIVEKFSEQRLLENFRGDSLSVNAKRNVSCVVSGSRRRVRVFEMESADEEFDESRLEEDGEDGEGENDKSKLNVSSVKEDN